MRRWALCIVAIFGCALVTQSQTFAASGGLQSGGGMRGGASGGFQSGARIGGTRGGALGTRGATPGAFPRGGFARPGFPGAGLAGRGFQGRLGTGRFGAGAGRFTGRDGRFEGREGRFEGREGRFEGREGRFGRFGENRLRGGFVAGVPAFVPLPDLLGLPFYDGFEYPYFFPDTSGPYLDDIYGFPPAWLPPAAGYGLPPQTDYLPPPDGTAGAAAPQVWYYCQDPMGYYPYVRDCNTNWQAVPASVLPPPTPQ